MTESFAELFEQSQVEAKMRPGSIVSGLVIDVRQDNVIVSAGLKSESWIPIDQFYDDKGELEVAVGDTVDVALDAVEDGYGETRLSREKAKKLLAWERLEEAYSGESAVSGMITERIKGGFTVDVDGVRAFLPGSLVDVKPVKDMTYLEGKPLEFKVIKLDRKRNNVVVSRRAVVESEDPIERQALLEKLKEGSSVKGIVKNLTGYGAFLDLGGIDGLLHVTDMAWKRVRAPSDIVNIGDEIEVKVLKFDHDRNRVSLGLKQMGEDPWERLDPVLSGRVPSAGPGHQSGGLRLFRRAGRGRGGAGACLGDGLDQQECPSRQAGPCGRRSGCPHPGHRPGSPPHLPGHEAVPAQSLGGLRRHP